LSAALELPTPHNFFFSVASDIASGLAYLHRRGVLHRDIKPSNVLLDGNVRDGRFRAKVSDFGLSTTSSSFDERDSNKTAETGTYRWMAPEIIRHEPYSIEADVYSFAILCWQLLTRENPFGNVSPLEAAGKVALELARPPFPQETPLGIQELISACWLEEPSCRLPVQEVLTLLVELETSLLTPEETTWLQAPMGHAVYRTTIKKSSSPLTPLVVVVVPPRLEAKHKEKKGGGLRAIFGHRSGPSMKHDHH
jgi:mitogen-activated protein kinase kinase kinase 11